MAARRSASPSDHYTAPTHYYVKLPNANHTVTWDEDAPMVDPTVRGCGFQIALAFTKNPNVAPDTSCTTSMPPLDFGAPPAHWLARVGITDLWE